MHDAVFRPEPEKPEQKDKSVRLGVQGLILAFVGLALVILFVWLGSLCAGNVTATMNNDGYQMPIMSLFGAIVFYVFALVSLITCSLSAVTFSQFQKKLNARKFGKVALIISLVCLLVAIVVSIVLIAVLAG